MAPLLLAVFAGAAGGAPYIPKDDSVVLERLPVRPGDPVARELRELRAALSRDPSDLETALKLARRYFELANAEGDPRYVGYAQAALGPWWNLPAPPLEATIMRGILRQYSHDFSAAMQDLEAATREDEDNTLAWYWRAAIDMVRADYAAAGEACAKLQRIDPGLGAVGCTAYLDGTTGKAGAAHKALSEALANAPRASPEVRLWVLTRLAEMSIRMGDPKQAEAHFRAALELNLHDQFLYAAWADFLLDHNRPAEVVALLRDWSRSDILLLRLALAEKALDAPEAKEHIDALKARFDAAALRGDKLHLQEEARFNLYLLGNKAKALALAQENWRTQREPRDARILLEAALALGDPDGARDALTWLRDSGYEEPGLHETASRLEGLRK